MEFPAKVLTPEEAESPHPHCLPLVIGESKLGTTGCAHLKASWGTPSVSWLLFFSLNFMQLILNQSEKTFFHGCFPPVSSNSQLSPLPTCLEGFKYPREEGDINREDKLR